jgi:hypothetical protein
MLGRGQWFLILGLALGVMGLAAARGAPAEAGLDLVPATVLAFDASLKECEAQIGQTNAFFTFWVTNVCETNVLILDVVSSCGCTVAQLPNKPWVLPSGESGPIKVTLDLRGRYGTVFKGLHITSSAGIKALVLRVNVPEPKAAPPATSVSSNAPAVRVAPPSGPPRASWEWKTPRAPKSR